MVGNGKPLSRKIFCIFLLSYVQHVRSAAPDTHEVDFKSFLQGILTSYLSPGCIGVLDVNTNTASRSEWCKSLDQHKDFILMDGDCDGSALNQARATVCDQTTTSAITTHITLITDSGETDTPHSLPGSIQLNTSATPTTPHGDSINIINTQDLLYRVLSYKSKSAHVDECKAASLVKLTKRNDVSKLCATVKQFKEILNDKCIKTDYDLLIVETLQLFNCLMCNH